MEAVFEIRNDADLFAALEKLKDGAWLEDIEIRFVDWPKYEIRIEGKDFKGGIPTRIMPALLEVQKNINRAYSRAVYGRVKNLSKEDKNRTELIVHLGNGSTIFETDLTEVLNTVVKEAIGKMTGPQIIGTILGVALIAGTTYAAVEYINSEAKEKQIDYQIEQTKEDTKRYEILSEVAKQNAAINEQLVDTIKAQATLMSRLHEDDRLYMKGKFLIDGSTSKQVLKKSSPEKVQGRLDGNFIILSVTSGEVADGFKIKVKSIKEDLELVVHIPSGTLNDEDIEALKTGEWSKQAVALSINTVKLKDKIVSATLVEAGLKLFGGPAR